MGLNMLGSITGFNWHIHQKTAFLFNKSLVRPKMDYGSFLFTNAETKFLKKLTQSRIFKKVQKNQSVVLKCKSASKNREKKSVY